MRIMRKTHPRLASDAHDNWQVGRPDLRATLSNNALRSIAAEMFAAGAAKLPRLPGE
jgi:hypothetical protein